MPKNKKYRNLKIVYENAPFKKNIEFVSFTGSRSELLKKHVTPKMMTVGYYWGRGQNGVFKYHDDLINYAANGKVKFAEYCQYYHPIKPNSGDLGIKVSNHDSVIVRIINLHFSRKRKKKTV